MIRRFLGPRREPRLGQARRGASIRAIGMVTLFSLVFAAVLLYEIMAVTGG